MFKCSHLLYTKTKPKEARRTGDPPDRHEGGRCLWADSEGERTAQTGLAAAILQGMDVLQGDVPQSLIRRATIYPQKFPVQAPACFLYPKT